MVKPNMHSVGPHIVVFHKLAVGPLVRPVLLVVTRTVGEDEVLWRGVEEILPDSFNVLSSRRSMFRAVSNVGRGSRCQMRRTMPLKRSSSPLIAYITRFLSLTFSPRFCKRSAIARILVQYALIMRLPSLMDRSSLSRVIARASLLSWNRSPIELLHSRGLSRLGLGGIHLTYLVSTALLGRHVCSTRGRCYL
ncbi:hypothetical protein CTI12_AA574820 [Artemisia annua]|uniref:Uncharacterized protein n=1 Tax=Artemisia annua TaxID=35608 RepID=A0A2U1KKJ7_ARTAN|nr:hypothetical protein CTI12_AA574820 [Artemisia annua]